MPETPETRESKPGITPEIHHIVAGIHIGTYSQSVPTDAVVSIGATPGYAPDRVSNAHIPVGYQVIDRDAVVRAADFVLRQVWAERTVLIRSERGRQRPPLVACVAILQMGGTYHDAMSCLYRALPIAAAGYLTDFRLLSLLKQIDQGIGGARASA